MSETEWLACGDQWPILEFLEGKTSERKVRLFAVSCCRGIWHLLEDERSRMVVEVAERFADGQVTEQERKSVHKTAPCPCPPDVASDASAALPENSVAELLACSAAFAAASAAEAAHQAALSADEAVASWNDRTFLQVAKWIAREVMEAVASFAVVRKVEAIHEIGIAESEYKRACLEEKMIQSVLLRDIFGNPFRPVAIDPAWLSPKVTSLAQTIYADRAFEKMPALADALQEAGCDNEDIISHCRGPGPHVKGCWVVDLVLGKE